MIRYYSYYSSGGYKTFYLGSNTDTDSKKYFFALLPVYEKKLKEGDDSVREKINKMTSLPQMGLVTSEDRHNLPDTASPLISHGGYKVAYMHLGGDHYVLALRDISGNAQDETGRSIPFLMLFISDSKEDQDRMNRLAVYCSSHLATVDTRISDMFYHDASNNGLCFDLKAMNEFVAQIGKDQKDVLLPLNDKDYEIVSAPGKVSLLVGNNVGKKYLMKELSITNKPTFYIEASRLIPMEKEGAKEAVQAKYQEELRLKKQDHRRLDLRDIIIAVVSGVVIIGGICALMQMCGSKG